VHRPFMMTVMKALPLVVVVDAQETKV